MPGGRGQRKRRFKLRGRWRYRATAFYKGRSRMRLCDSEAEARALEPQLLAELRREVDGGGGDGPGGGGDPLAPDAPVTVAGAIFMAADTIDANPTKGADSGARARQVARLLATDFAPLATLPIPALTPAHLVAFRDARRAAGRAAGTINRDLRVLRAAVKRLRPDFHVPTEDFLPESDLHVESLTPAEAALFTREGAPGQPGKKGAGWDPADPMPWPFNAMAAVRQLTGLRRAEVANLTRAAVRLDLGRLVTRVKGGSTEGVALSQAVIAILTDALARHESPYVFPNLKTGRPYTGPSISRVHRLRARAALGRPYRLHDDRHHAATKALAAGYSRTKLQHWLRLKSAKMVDRYAHLERGEQIAMSEAVAALTLGHPLAATDRPGSESRRGGRTSRRAPAVPA